MKHDRAAAHVVYSDPFLQGRSQYDPPGSSNGYLGTDRWSSQVLNNELAAVFILSCGGETYYYI